MKTLELTELDCSYLIVALNAACEKTARYHSPAWDDFDRLRTHVLHLSHSFDQASQVASNASRIEQHINMRLECKEGECL